MIKHASIFRVSLSPTASFQKIEEAAKAASFVPCTASQERSVGWVPPRGQENGALVESSAGHHVMKLMIETRAVPGKALQEAVEKKCQEIEAATGRKPGKKETRDIKDDVRMTLLPMAFSTYQSVLVWIDEAAGTMVVDATVATKVDEVVTQFVRLSDDVSVALLSTMASPASVMSAWLVDRDDLSSADRFGFDVSRTCELTAADESKGKIKYTNLNVLCDEVVLHIKQGKFPSKLALTYEDRVALTLTNKGTLTGIKFLDVVFEKSKDTKEDVFDADVAIMTGEMSKVVASLVQALGGYISA